MGADARVRTVIVMSVVSVVLNYLWELAQAPLYVGLESYNSGVLWHCFVASLGDGLMVLLIIVAGRITLHRWNWFERPGIAGYFIMLTAGLLLALSVEWGAVYLLGRWQYTVNMPTIVGPGIGVIPIAQMLVLPPLIFWTVHCFAREK